MKENAKEKVVKSSLLKLYANYSHVCPQQQNAPVNYHDISFASSQQINTLYFHSTNSLDSDAHEK